MPGLDSESTVTTSPSNGARRLCSGANPLRESQVTSESHRDERDSGLRGKMRQFTSRELCRLNQLHNAHLAYRGKVYDVSSFVSSHPGGVEQIMMGAGRDITSLFESYHKLDTVKVLDKYCVGELVDNELPVFPERSEFALTVRKRVEKHMKDNNLDPKVNYWMFLSHAVTFCLVAVFYYLTISLRDSILVHLLCASVWGILVSVVAFTAWHDACHYSVTHSPRVWKALMTLSEVLVGISSYVWRYHHTFGHHVYTNIDLADPDIATNPKSTVAIRRILHKQKWIRRYVYQPIYLPFMYMMLGMRLRFQDFHSLYHLQRSYIRMNPPDRSNWIIFWTAKSIHFMLMYGIPLFYMSLWRLLLMTLVYEAAYSGWLALITALNHVTSEIDWPQPDKDNVMHTDWSVNQVATTRDYATSSLFWFYITGGLNHQTAHHLFPGVLQCHYLWITPIIKETCAEFNVKYNEANTFLEAVGLHFDHLKFMGRGEDLKKDKLS